MERMSFKPVYDPIYQMAVDIMDKEWIAAGKTQEELDQEEQISDIVAELMASGKSFDEIEEMWKGKSNAQILEEYAPVVASR